MDQESLLAYRRLRFQYLGSDLSAANHVVVEAVNDAVARLNDIRGWSRRGVTVGIDHANQMTASIHPIRWEALPLFVASNFRVYRYIESRSGYSREVFMKWKKPETVLEVALSIDEICVR